MAHRLDEVVYKVALKHTVVSADTLKAAVKEATTSGSGLLGILLKDGRLSEEEFMRLIAAELKLEYLTLRNVTIDKRVTETIPYRFAWHYKFLPLKIEDHALTIAVSEPLDIKTQDELRLHFGYEIRVVITSERQLKEAFANLYGVGADTLENLFPRPR